MNRAELEALRDTYRDGLLDDTLTFWLKHGIDRENGGYFSSLDRDGTLYQATGDPAFGEKAVELFGTFRRHQEDPSLSPFPPKFTGTRPSKAIDAPMIVLNIGLA